MTAFPWMDKMRRPGRGGRAVASGPRAAVGFDGDQFRFLLTQAAGADGRHRLLRWGALAREQRTEAQWLAAIRALRLGRGPVTAMLAPHEYQLLTVDLPAVPDDELKAAARWRIKDMISAPPEEVTIDVLRLPGAGGTPPRQMLVVVAPNAVIRQTMLRCRTAGLTLGAIDIPELGLRNLVSPAGRPQDLPGGAVATLVEAGPECWFSLCEGGELLAVRRFPNDGESGVSERVVGELRRSIDRLERQFPDLRLAALVADMGLWTADYLAALKATTQLPCLPFRPAAHFDTEGLEALEVGGDPAFLALTGIALRDDAMA